MQEYIKRAQQSRLSWPLPPELGDVQLEALLFQNKVDPNLVSSEPDWAEIDRELRRKGVTRHLLWQEHQQQHPDSVQYATFARNYRRWKMTAGLSMRQTHRAGEKLFVDYAGVTLGITDAQTGLIHPGQVFVATLGASDYTYAEVTRTQTSADWLASHVRALAFFGGVPELIVPDNLRAGVTHASFYDPELNPAYAAFAQHYGVAIIPARVRKPKDKALVEVHVQIVERRLLAPLRHQTFFSVTDANVALWDLLAELNTNPFQKRLGSRLSQFMALDQPLLRPVPTQPFELATWKRTTVGLDYHVELDGHFYSVPYLHAKSRVDLRLTPHLLEIFRDGVQIAVHARVLDVSSTAARQTTVRDHRPAHHQQYADWTPQRLLTRAEHIGPATRQVAEQLLSGARHPEQGFRACFGLFKLSQAYSPARLEAACERALRLHTCRYRSIESILKHRLDEQPAAPEDSAPRVLDHANVRGSAYYDSTRPEQDASETVTSTLAHEFDPTLN